MIIYTAKSGDTLYGIARSYGLTVGELQRFNGLPDPDRIAVGQDILIPISDSLHTVSRGESLYSIAMEYGTTVENILERNPELRPPYMIYPGMVLYIPSVSAARKTIDVNGYAYPGINRATLESTLPFLTYLSIFSHRVSTDGTLGTVDDGWLISSAVKAVVSPVMVITNTDSSGSFRSEIANTVLNSDSIRSVLIENTVSTARSKGYRGVDVDFEYIYPDDREKYNEFLSALKAELDRYGLSLSTAVAPKLSADQQGTLYEAHDYTFHGKSADRVILMTYEWGYLYGPPMAVAPLSEVKKVLTYAVTAIPPEKLLMGMPNYGYDWLLPYESGTPADILSINGAILRAADTRSIIQFSETDQSPFYEYTEGGRDHIVWFENPRSIKAKLGLVKDFNLSGISIWTVNQFYLQAWRVITDTFGIRKLSVF